MEKVQHNMNPKTAQCILVVTLNTTTIPWKTGALKKAGAGMVVGKAAIVRGEAAKVAAIATGEGYKTTFAAGNAGTLAG